MRHLTSIFKPHLLCGLGALLMAAPHLARAIDCQKASTDIEKAVCADTDVMALDEQLTRALAAALQSHPSEQHALLLDERHWLARRDASCTAGQDGASKMHQCLTEAYRARLSVLQQAASSTSAAAPTTATAHADSDTAACRTLLDRYRPVANAHPGEFPLNVLAHTATSGLRLLPPGEALVDASSGLASWAGKQQPPLKISSELSQALTDDPSGGKLQKVPGLPLYVLGRMEGSAGCDSSLFFVVKDGVAQSSPAPFEDGEGDCSTEGILVSLDGKPLYIRQDYDFGPGTKASLEIATWSGDRLHPACTISLTYAPLVKAETLNDHDDACKVADCGDMRKTAFDLVKAKVTGTLAADALSGSLTTPQRLQYQTEAAVVAKAPDNEASEGAVLVPYIQQGAVYVVRIADRTIGWRDFADQSVKFERVDGGKIVVDGDYTVGVWKGDLQEASVR